MGRGSMPGSAVFWREFVGNSALKRRLMARLKRCEGAAIAFPGTILAGPAGVGKTTLAGIVATAIGRRCVARVGPNLRRGALRLILGKLRERDILFIDELGEMDRDAQVLLAAAVRSAKARGAGFTVIGTAFDMRRVIPALRRLLVVERLGRYSKRDIARIVMATAREMGGGVIDRSRLAVIVSESRGIARRARNLTKRELTARMLPPKK